MMDHDERAAKAAEYAAMSRRIADEQWEHHCQLGILYALNALYLQGTLKK